MKSVVTAILGGGQGSRLWPLTQHRAKPAVPVAGKFRLIDVPISNSLHAGIDQIFVLTQFNSAGLHRHIAQTYRFDAFSKGFVNILAALLYFCLSFPLARLVEQFERKQRAWQ